jgi:hypothetical protein
MKQQIILWTGAFVITVIFGTLLRIISPEKPVTGTVEFGNEKVGYKFDRVYRSDSAYAVELFSDIDSLQADLEYRDADSGNNWIKIPMKNDEGTLSAYIPKHHTKSLVDYRVALKYQGQSFIVPQKDGLTLKFLGRVSTQIMAWFYIALFGGILLSTRIGLEFFNENEKIKKLSFFAFITFVFYAMLLIPVKRTYELSAFGKSIPQINQLFSVGGTLIIVLWIGGMISFFYVKNRRLMALVVAILTFLIFLIFGY